MNKSPLVRVFGKQPLICVQVSRCIIQDPVCTRERDLIWSHSVTLVDLTAICIWWVSVANTFWSMVSSNSKIRTLQCL